MRIEPPICPWARLGASVWARATTGPQNLALGVGYTFLWSGDLDMDVNRGPLAGRVSGTYEKHLNEFHQFIPELEILIRNHSVL